MLRKVIPLPLVALGCKESFYSRNSEDFLRRKCAKYTYVYQSDRKGIVNLDVFVVDDKLSLCNCKTSESYNMNCITLVNDSVICS